MANQANGLLSSIAALAAWVYGRIIARRNARFDAGRGVQRIDRPVISVGNITVGGTGKSPMVLWIVRELRAAGCSPAIAMRGYGATSGEKNDEQLEYEWHEPDVPIVACPDRYAALSEFLPAHPNVDCVVLDDGFQHRQLHRDLDLVLVDASGKTFDQALLPAGRLREPAQSLQRADAVIVTRACAVDSQLMQSVARAHGRPPIAWTQHRWSDLLVSAGGIQQHEPVHWLDDKRMLVMLGVGNPRAVELLLEQAGATIAARIPARDHERYDRAKLATARGLCTGVDAMFLTAKDWVKIRTLVDSADWPCPIVVPQLAIDVHHGAADLRAMLLKTVRPT